MRICPALDSNERWAISDADSSKVLKMDKTMKLMEMTEEKKRKITYSSDFLQKLN